MEDCKDPCHSTARDEVLQLYSVLSIWSPITDLGQQRRRCFNVLNRSDHDEIDPRYYDETIPMIRWWWIWHTSLSKTTHEKGETRFQYHPSCLAAQFETRGTRHVNGTSRADKSDNITIAKFHQELFLEHGELMTWELQHRKVGKLVLAARWSMHLACCIWQSLFSERSIGNILEHVLRKVVSNLKCQLCRSQLCWAVRSRSFA